MSPVENQILVFPVFFRSNLFHLFWQEFNRNIQTIISLFSFQVARRVQNAVIPWIIHAWTIYSGGLIRVASMTCSICTQSIYAWYLDLCQRALYMFYYSAWSVHVRSKKKESHQICITIYPILYLFLNTILIIFQ